MTDHQEKIELFKALYPYSNVDIDTQLLYMAWYGFGKYDSKNKHKTVTPEHYGFLPVMAYNNGWNDWVDM